MPRTIVVPSGTGGVITYQLGSNESFTLESLTALLTSVNGGYTDTILLDCRDAKGGIIYRQAVDLGPNAPTFYSLAPGSEPMWIVPGSIDNGWPQQFNADQAFYTERLAPVTLTPGCTIYMIAANSGAYPDTDPLDTLDPDAAWDNLLLWVEDVGKGPQFGDVGNAILLGIGA